MGNYWEDLSKKIHTPGETMNKRGDQSQEIADYIKRYLSPNDEVLDLGAGSGLITNKIYQDVKHVIAVETYPGFTQFIEEDDKILVINANLENFVIRKEFDVILSTGVMQLFTKDVALEMYKNAFQMLKKGGILFVRSHCGIKETVIVKHSKELDTDYYAEYRQIDEERELILSAGFSEVEVRDDTPAALNIYDNTHHYYLICKK